VTTSAEPSLLRAWFYLVGLSLRRQARARQMVWIALGLLAFACAFVAVNTAADRWNMRTWRWRSGTVAQSYADWLDDTQLVLLALPRTAPGGAPDLIVVGAVKAFVNRAAFQVFSKLLVLSLFLGFLLPVWSLAFATEAFGGDRESNSLVWLLSRPLPRPAIYLAKFVAVLPWSLVLNVGGFALLCVLAGPPGRQALQLFWPAVVWATLAFCALFHLIGALFRRPAIIACVYVFFLEIILNLMPGYVKRISISFYARCLVFEAGGPFGIHPDNPAAFLPVTGSTALTVLVGATVLLLGLGTVLFSRMQYQDGGV
jgi:ABC-type transport system involved in multi-copper enzyme maturation permease subunit